MMNRLFETIQSHHHALLQQWDEQYPNDDTSEPPHQRRLAHAAVLLIAHGPVGYEAAINLVQLPLAQLTVVGVHDTDRDALTAVGAHPHRQAAAFTVVPQPFTLTGFGLLLGHYHLLAAAWNRPYPAFAEAINAESLRIGVPWTQVTLWGAEVVLGPTIIPHATACYVCTTQRRRANETRQDVAQAIDAFLRNDLSFDFRGQLTPLLQLAAAYLRAEVTRFIQGTPAPIALSRLITIDALAQITHSDFVVPVEHCPACATSSLERFPANDSLLAMIARACQRRRERYHATR